MARSMIQYAAALVAAAVLTACQLTPTGPLPKGEDALTTRFIPVAEDAWGGSSINVLANVKQTLFTDGVYQYAAYYDHQARLVVGKRRMGEQQWQLSQTDFTGNVHDAHNHIALVADGDGYLHLSWDHHNSRLNYARSDKPGSLQFVRQPMLGLNEQAVTYPAFYRFNDGSVLFSYRDGGSGHGNTLINRYDPAKKSWSRVVQSLIDGEGQRSAYADMYVDQNDVLHLAWVWRETPDVATNHDLMYAQSKDQGQSWQTITGQTLSLPMTALNTQPVVQIPQQHNLMNPPAVSADRLSVPYIANYWSDDADSAPRWGVTTFRDDEWLVVRGPEAQPGFSLAGHGTKNPPWSRAALLVEWNWETSWFHLVYRDDQTGSIDVLTVEDLTEPNWKRKHLTGWPADGWEPSVDPQQWLRLGQAHMLTQHVVQQDGNDYQGASVAPQALSVMVWSAKWEHHQVRKASQDTGSDEQTADPIIKQQVLDVAKRSASWQWQNLPEGWNYHPLAWGICPLYIGSLEMDEYLPDAGLADKVRAVGEQFHWEMHDRVYDADDYCVAQAWLPLYQLDQDPAQLAGAKKRFDYILENPAKTKMDWGAHGARDRWTWSDALFMGPVAWLQMYQVTGEQKYLDFVNAEWWTTYNRLFSEDIGLYFRDESYLDIRERNGKTIHWARGTGWSIAGLARMIEGLPSTHPDYARYVKQFELMADAFMRAQQPDGLWRPGLLDPKTHSAKETSGSSFAVFALAWGINHGFLERDVYLASVQKGWAALSKSVQDNGKLKNVQPIGAAPHGFDPNNAEPFATGAFLLAASEVLHLAQN